MSKGQPAQQAPVQPQARPAPAPEQPKAESELSLLRAELAMLRDALSGMALLILPVHMRNRCSCGALACRTVTALQQETQSQQDFYLCEDCKLDDDWRMARSLELSPNDRATVRIANKVCLPPASSASSPS